MIALARSYVWWPRAHLDQDIEEMVTACHGCQSEESSPLKAAVHPWIWPMRPWQCIYVDFAGPLQRKSYLLVIDAHSEWPEIIEMPTTTSAKTIEVLRNLFSRYGIPLQIVLDNGPQFTSAEFAKFNKKISCTLTPPGKL